MARHGRAYSSSQDSGDGDERRAYEARQERPLSNLFSDLARDTSDLVRREVELAKAEMSEKMGIATKGVSSMAVGGGVAFAGLLFLLLAATYGLGTVMPMWAAALIVGVVVSGIGGILVMSGRGKLRTGNLQPQRTIQTLREDKEWAKAQLSR